MHLDPVTLEQVRHVLQIVRLAMFAGFVGLGFRVLLASPRTRRSAVNHLLIYTLLAHLAVAIPQNEAWPFSMYPMMATDASNHRRTQRGIFFRAIDAQGRSWRVDRLAWSPLFPQAIMGWFEVGFNNATPTQQREALAFLLDRAENARLRRHRGNRFFGNDRLLGSLAAPDTNLWGSAPQSSQPLRALRVERIEWNPRDLAYYGRIDSRRLLCEYRK